MHSNIRKSNSSNDMSGINTPIAESTILEEKRKNSRRGIFKRRTISPISNASKQLSRTNLDSPSAKIDPHVITDAESNGLVSRIVKYYENSQQELEKNKSVYNKFGQFPIVHLKKNEIKFSPRNNLVRSSSSSGRIAPPDKGIFNRNYRSAILRSNSLMSMPGQVPKLAPTLMKKNEVNKIIASNNEPLSPITGEEHHYPIQSKSVLDALKEISRKRINNEEINMDRTKKYCYTQPDMIDSPLMMGESMSAKRPREQVSPSKTPKKIKMKNNDILSSLSSSQYLKRKADVFEDIVIVPSSILQPRREQEVAQKSSSPPISVSQQISQISQQKEIEVVKIVAPAINQQSTKKLTLFNQQSSIPEMPKRLATNEGEEEEESDEFRVNFIKPKNQKISVDTKISLNNVEKSKLSLMLSCLGGDLDEPEMSSKKPKEQDKIDGKTSQEISESSTATISFATNTITSNVAPISTSSLSTINSLSSNPVVSSSESPALTITVDSASIPSMEKPKETKEAPLFSFGDNTSATNLATVPTSQNTALTTQSTDSKINTVEPQSNPLKLLEDASKTNKNLLGLFGNVSNSTESSVDPNKSLISFTTPAKPAEEPKIGIGIAFPKPSIGGFNIQPPPVSSSIDSASTLQFPGKNIAVPSFTGFTPSSTISSTTTTISNPMSILSTAPQVASKIGTFGNNQSSTGLFGNGSTGMMQKSDEKPGLTGNNNMSILGGGSLGLSGKNNNNNNNNMSILNDSIGILGNKVTTSSILSQPSAPSFTFGDNNNKPAFNFESSSTATTNALKPTFSFGSKQEAPIPSFDSFKSPSSIPENNNTFGSSSLFSQNQNSGTIPTIGGFSFGSNQPNSQQTVTTTATGIGFSFQSPPVTTSSNSGGFSFQSPSTDGSSFKLGSQPATTTTSSFNFSSQEKPSDAVKPSFSFGGSQQPSALVPPQFGSSISTTTTQQQQPSTNSSNMFAFGSNNNNNSSNNQQANNTSSSTFTFKAPSSQTSSSNVFGSNTGGSGNDVSATFNLKLPSQSQGIFGQNQQQTQNASIFGQPQNQQNSSAPPPYQFGGSSAPSTQDSSQNKPFAFGGSISNSNSNISANPTNIFGSNSAPSSTFNFSASSNPVQQSTNTNGMFNFNSSVPGNANPAPNPFGAQPQSSLFNMGASSAQQRRPIRQATRRLK